VAAYYQLLLVETTMDSKITADELTIDTTSFKLPVVQQVLSTSDSASQTRSFTLPDACRNSIKILWTELNYGTRI